MIKKLSVLLIVMLTASLGAMAQGAEMADVMRSNGKIYVVVAVAAIVMVGIIIYMITLDRKISKMEKDNK